MIKAQAGPFEILCADPMEEARAASYWTKEPGTIEWLDEIRPGEVVYDIGANIGLYTLAAAKAVGPLGHVCAFEPHIWNAASLMRNVIHNNFQDRVRVMTCALGERVELSPFVYSSKRPGSSGHQLLGRHTSFASSRPGVTELKAVVSLDWLLWQLPSPHRIKIDVDGQEAEILRGAQQMLTSRKPESVQVEIDPSRRAEVEVEMERAGYTLRSRHYTAAGRAALDAGADPWLTIHNAVYTRPS